MIEGIGVGLALYADDGKALTDAARMTDMLKLGFRDSFDDLAT